MEKLLKFFKDNGVALQITQDARYKPTVHAIPQGRSMVDLEKTEGETVIEALENMKTKLFGDKVELRVRDRVSIIDKNGNKLAEGTIININEFREPSMMYAVDVDGYTQDVLFFGESQLSLII